MKNKKLIISIICIVVVLIIGIITLLIINNSNTIDLNKITSFEYHSGNNNSFILVTGNKNNDLFDIEIEELISVNENKNTNSLSITSDEFKELLKKTSQEDCKKHTYEYQCGERDDCSSASFKINLEDKKNAVCYQINSEVIDYFNSYSNTDAEDDEIIDSQVDWTNLEFTINGIQYKYPYKISELLNNGWTPKTSDDQIILNELVGYIDEETIKYYESIGVSKENITLGYKGATLTQNGIDIWVYADNTVSDIKVSDAIVVSLMVSEATNSNKNNFSFYGINFGDSKEKIESLFGNKNCEITSDETNYEYSYSKQIDNNLTAQINFRINIGKNSLDQFTINYYQN